MTLSELPSFFRDIPLTSTGLAAHAVDTILCAQDRKQNTLMLLVCDRHARAVQPILISDVPWEADDYERGLAFQLLELAPDTKVLVAVSSRRRIDEDLVSRWAQTAHAILGDRLLHFFSVTPAEIRAHTSHPLSTAR